MTPLTTNPNAVILLNPEGRIEAVASNVAPDLKVVITSDRATFADEAANKPFDTTRPVQPEQVMAMRKH